MLFHFTKKTAAIKQPVGNSCRPLIKNNNLKIFIILLNDETNLGKEQNNTIKSVSRIAANADFGDNQKAAWGNLALKLRPDP